MRPRDRLEFQASGVKTLGEKRTIFLSKSIEVVKTASNKLKLTPEISSKRKEPKEKFIYILFLS